MEEHYGLNIWKPIVEVVWLDGVDNDEKEKDDQIVSEDVPEIKNIQDSYPKKIVVEVMTSLPNSLRKKLLPLA